MNAKSVKDGKQELADANEYIKVAVGTSCRADETFHDHE